MSPRRRTALYVVSAILAFSALCFGVARMPPFGTFSGPYTDFLLDAATGERHVYNIPTAINFDYRGFDTLGEEFIFFTSVTGLLFLFSGVKNAESQGKEAVEHDRQLAKTGAMLWFPTGLAAFVAAMGMDIGAHGQLTPGGGFQGGAIFASAFACIYLGIGTRAVMRAAPKEVMDSLEALGGFAFGALGVAALFIAGAFLQNILPLRQTGTTVSGGTIYFLSCAVFCEIGCGFALLLITFIKQTHESKESGE